MFCCFIFNMVLIPFHTVVASIWSLCHIFLISSSWNPVLSPMKNHGCYDGAACLPLLKVLINCPTETIFDFLQQQLNPIENRSAICKTLIAKEGCITKTTMISLVIQIRFHDKDIENICQKLIKPMSKQYGEIIKNKRGRIY